MNGTTYIASLWTKEDTEICGLDYRGNFSGDQVQINRLVFSDGTQMTSAGVSLPNSIDAGTF